MCCVNKSALCGAASIRFLEVFASNIRNAKTRKSYAQAALNHASTRTTQL
jgi:hypothetical protein